MSVIMKINEKLYFKRRAALKSAATRAKGLDFRLIFVRKLTELDSLYKKQQRQKNVQTK